MTGAVRLQKKWQRTLFVTLLIITAFGLGIFSDLVGAQQAPQLTNAQLERLRIHPIPGKEGLYVMPGFDGSLSGGNIAVRVTGGGVIIVDNKFSYSARDIIEQVASISSEPIRYVFNTHHHSDHAGSNADFMPAAQVIGHENARANMLRNNLSGAPPLTYSERSSIFLNGVEAQTHHFGRGHTDGDSVIYFPDLKTVHTGDLFIWGDRLDGSTMAPFIDFANGGSAVEWTATLDGLLTLDFDTAIPGHGPILRKADVRIFRSKFEQLMSQISQLIGEGVSRADIVDRLDTASLNWPFAPARVQAIYDELTAADAD